MDESSKEASNNLETTLSSELISFPSGQKFDNISTVTEISDSELEVKKLNSDLDCSEANGAQQSGKRVEFENMNYVSSTTNSQYQGLPPQVRSTLQDNANMLVDKSILNDLLHPQNANYANNILNLQRKFDSIALQCPGDQSQVHDVKGMQAEKLSSHPLLGGESREPVRSPYLSISSTPKKTGSHSGLQSSTNPVVKRVNFADPKFDMNKIANDKNKDLFNNISINDGNKQIYNMHSFISYGPELVYDKLSAIRNHLDINMKEGENETDTSDLPLSRLLVAKLNNQKQRTKDLEEELTVNEASLAKTTCELEVVQKRLMRREEQLREAGEEVGKLQQEWQSIQHRLVSSRDKFQAQNEIMKKVIESMKLEKEKLELELNRWKQEADEAREFKARSEGMRAQVESSYRQTEQILEENKRLNIALKEKEDRIQSYEKDIIPDLESSKQAWQKQVDALERELEAARPALGRAKEEAKQLQERHAVLLQKAVEEAEERQRATKEKDAALDINFRLKNDQQKLVEELHHHYQREVESIVIRKVEAVSAEFVAKEKRMQETFLAQIDGLKKLSESEKSEISRRAAEEIALLKRRTEEASRREVEWREALRENDLLKGQRDAIVAAVSTVLPQAAFKIPAIPSQDACPRRQPSQMSKYHFTHLGNLETYPRDQKAPSKKKGIKKSGSRGVPPAVPPLVTSTSLSSVTSEVTSDDTSSEGKVTVREGGHQPPRRRDQMAAYPQSGKFPGQRVVPASYIVGGRFGVPLSSSSGASKEDVLKEVDLQVEDLIHEINSMSEIMAPYSANETPRHDTSLE